MKRTLALILAVFMIFCLFAACGEKKDTNPKIDGAQTSASQGTTSAQPSGAGQTGTAISTTTGQTPQASGAAASSEVGNYSQNQLREMTVHPSDDAEFVMAFSFTFTSLTELGHQNDHACVTFPFYETLFNYDTITNRIAPGLAESWEYTDDYTLRVKLYPGIKSIAGDPVTASDVLWSLNYYNDSGLLPTYMAVLDFPNIKVVDDLTIDIATKDPYPYLTLDMTCHYFSVGCEKSAKAIAYDEATGTWDQHKLDWDPAPGTGPYKLVSTDEVSYIKCVRNDDYWQGTLPYYKYITINVNIDATARGMSVEAGDATYANNLSASTGAALMGNDNFTVWNTATLGSTLIFRCNTEVEALRNKALRQAMALAIDYESLVEVGMGGAAIPTYNAMCPNTVTYYTEPDDATNFIRYDIELAKQKMIEAGYPNGGVSFTFLYSTAQPYMSKMAEALQYMLKEIGVTLVLEPMENIASFEKAKAGDFELYMSGAQNPNPKINVTRVEPNSNYFSVPGWTNPQYWYEGDINDLQKLCETIYTETDPDLNMAAWAEIQALTREYVPMWILCQPSVISISSAELVGMSFTGDGDPNFAWFYEAPYITG